MGYLFDPSNWEWLTSGNNLKFLFTGFLANIEIALVAMVLSLILGLVLALLRLSKNKPVSWIAGAWIDVWRNLPLIFILLFLFLLLPDNMKEGWADFAPDFFPVAFQSSGLPAAIVGLTLYNSAVIAEIFRAGIVSLERGQGEAAAALGLPYWKSMRLVILPQGLRRMVPATVSQLITLNKDTTLVSLILIEEALKRAKIVINTSGSPFTGTGVPAPTLHVYLTIGLMFVLVNLALSRLSKRLEIRERKRTGTDLKGVTGLEDQVALEADVA
jgi:glutamate transport system permease protein